MLGSLSRRESQFILYFFTTMKRRAVKVWYDRSAICLRAERMSKLYILVHIVIYKRCLIHFQHYVGTTLISPGGSLFIANHMHVFAIHLLMQYNGIHTEHCCPVCSSWPSPPKHVLSSFYSLALSRYKQRGDVNLLCHAARATLPSLRNISIVTSQPAASHWHSWSPVEVSSKSTAKKNCIEAFKIVLTNRNCYRHGTYLIST